mmetsp:Transcript_27122/g.64407  ORF Transcript_27122/g.64407 Transcript_27122/m.64407 type:complete len:101 (-) Transcript_27122:696-998(-)|eukprot:CAMPEP_0175821680 /NCGR_PEP_ID=MMETSP0107_2-20121207/9274_1 /TAXON_ID=195067 ORGANISM="Goniomonas pacifica, Strain CCMP1869" /NCGR_SAMPLE_ID=MMETSP0107_2 /ASSEMBLY_ACC=CAM_ASM_000203 /LENGTH=100 /DNA_ID=CAMNT_0017134095 /DNA_START=52 /DNA_END=354 /DNA_ORIENTATION=+
MTALTVEFGGGLELLFGKQKEHKISVPSPSAEKKLVIRDLLAWIREHLLQERPEMFLAGESVRPGILVLVNDVDWELEGTLEYELQENDKIVFISTLHGG